LLFDTVVELVESQYPTYHPWAEALALWTIANAAPKSNIRFTTKRMPITFNAWAVGPSRFGYKSTPAKLIVEDILEKTEAKTIPPRLTTEYFIKYLAEKDIDSAYLYRDETSGLIAETRKQYMADELSFLSEALDGMITARGTMTHGLTEKRKIQLNFLSTCTPDIYNNIEESFWNQGLGNRMIAVNWMETEAKMPIQDIELGEKLTAKAVEEFNNIKAANVSEVDITVSENRNSEGDVRALMMYEEFTKRQEALKSYFNDKWDIRTSYKYESQVHARKIAALRSIDRYVEAGLPPHVCMEDYVWAKKWMEDRVVEHSQMYDDFRECKLRAKVGTVALSVDELIMKIIRDNGGKATESELYKKLYPKKVDTLDRDRAIGELIIAQRLKMEVVNTSTNKAKVYISLE